MKETIEEIALKLYPVKTVRLNTRTRYDANKKLRNAFVEGYKLAEENSDNKYSEEEVEELVYNICGTIARLEGIVLNGKNVDKAFKQHKK